MARFTCLQYWQLIIFCFYWFVFFPILWFLIRPDIFAASILSAILFALILLVVYYVLYYLIDCCCQAKESPPAHKRVWPRPFRRRAQNPVYSATTIYMGESGATRVRMPDTVMYENVSHQNNQAEELICHEQRLRDEERKNVRFITSCSLYYDGQDFHGFK